MHTALRVITVLLGVLFVVQGFGWLYDPAAAATGLGMPLLDGMGRSTQIGDFASFFLVGGATILVGSLTGRPRVLYVPAALIGGAAITRTLAWALHGADFAAFFIFVELVTGGVLIASARAATAKPY